MKFILTVAATVTIAGCSATDQKSSGTTALSVVVVCPSTEEIGAGEVSEFFDFEPQLQKIVNSTYSWYGTTLRYVSTSSEGDLVGRELRCIYDAPDPNSNLPNHFIGTHIELRPEYRPVVAAGLVSKWSIRRPTHQNEPNAKCESSRADCTFSVHLKEQ